MRCKKLSNKAKIGWIGLGQIGSIMAVNLLRAGYTLIVHDLRPQSAEKLVAAGL